ncbi:hypothetical protein [Roseibium sp.]|uniref:hypothetical protein n=1 Tax=Roseibium sp. TaxID=1936156 RepID=UPI003A97E464
MQIDLKDPTQLTIENVSALIGSKDDSMNRQLRVTKDGIAFLSDRVGNDGAGEMHCYFETWIAGNDYCGLNAATDQQWVSAVYQRLVENWPDLKHGKCIDY